MKQLLLSALLLLFSIALFAQATPVTELRIADNTTNFGVNISKGTKVYNYGDGKYYVCITAALSTEDLTDAAAKFVLLNPAEQTLSRTAAGVITLSDNSTVPASPLSTITFTGTNLTVENGAAGVINLKPDQALSYAQTDDETNTISLENSATTAVLLKSSATLAGLMTAAQFNKLKDITDAPIGSYYVEDAEVAASPSVTYPLAKTPKDIATPTPTSKYNFIQVILNGFPLKPGTQYTLSGNTITIITPLLTYDKLSFGYIW